MTKDALKYLQPNAVIPIDMETTSLLVNALKKALSEHAMQEVQRLGQEIEQEPVALHCCGYTDASAVKWNPLNGVVQCHNCGQTYTPPQRTEQEPCAHAKTPKECYRVRCQLGDKCVDDEMSFRTTPPQPEQEPVAFASHGVINWIADKQFQHEADLYTTPPQRKPLTDEEMKKIWYALLNIMGWYSFQEIARAIEAAHGIKENT